MGYYINYLPNGEELPVKGKVEKLLTIEGAEVIDKPTKWVEGIVCIVMGNYFDAAGYCYNQEELKAFANPDGRPRQWLYIPNAKQLSGYN